MDKKLMLAVAGAGKTTYITNTICSHYSRVLIVTYTDSNYENIIKKLRDKNDGRMPEGVAVYTYFKFLYSFCYKPFLSDIVAAKGINYEPNPNQYAKSNTRAFYVDSNNRLYSNRLSFLLEHKNVIDDIKERIKKYFDCFVFDEVQDVSGRDFNLLEKLIDTEIDIFFVGDYYQHTYNTSADGNVNTSLFDDINKYVKRFVNAGMEYDNKSLVKSWRCGESICKYVRERLNIEIYSNKGNIGKVIFLESSKEIKEKWDDLQIIKLHYQKSSQFGRGHKNWGDTKGEDCYGDVMVLLNKTTMEAYRKEELSKLPSLTRNKLYVAITRAKGTVYIADERIAKDFKTN